MTTPVIRKPLLQIDLLNQRVLIADPDLARTDNPEDAPGNFSQVDISDALKAKFLETIGNFWHTEDDKLEFFAYYSDKTFIVHRERLKYDFKSDSNYLSKYEFKGATKEQGEYVYDVARSLFQVIRQYKRTKALEAIKSVEKEVSYFEAKYLKKKREKKLMLASSDWRVLPDVPEAYTGEKDRWVAWRQKIREVAVMKPEDYNDLLSFARDLYVIKYPVDPEIYREKYPNDMLEDGVTPAPAFMDPDDDNQWTVYDSYASKDFVDDRMLNALIYAKVRVKSPVYVDKQVRDIIKAMQIENIDPDFDSSLFVLPEAEE